MSFLGDFLNSLANTFAMFFILLSVMLSFLVNQIKKNSGDLFMATCEALELPKNTCASKMNSRGYFDMIDNGKSI